LKSMMELLRPGGVAVFTFNDCDYPQEVDKVEKMRYCYTNGHVVRKLCTNIGYNILADIRRDEELLTTVSWLEIQKPGTLNSLRGGQNLAAIKYLGENI